MLTPRWQSTFAITIVSAQPNRMVPPVLVPALPMPTAAAPRTNAAISAETTNRRVEYERDIGVVAFVVPMAKTLTARHHRMVTKAVTAPRTASVNERGTQTTRSSQRYGRGMELLNEFGQPVGTPLPDTWVPPGLPTAPELSGRYVRLERLQARHTPDLWNAFASAPHSLWTYMSDGPFSAEGDLARSVERMTDMSTWQPYAVCVAGRATGFASFMRIDPAVGVLEIGSIAFAPVLQRTTEATETLYLMIKHAFDLGYRRCEWKCDDLNAPSRQAALRLGFVYEGTFRSATHYKGRNRDTAWFAIIDTQWPELRSSFEQWLDPKNFDDAGRQLRPLRSH